MTRRPSTAYTLAECLRVSDISTVKGESPEDKYNRRLELRVEWLLGRGMQFPGRYVEFDKKKAEKKYKKAVDKHTRRLKALDETNKARTAVAKRSGVRQRDIPKDIAAMEVTRRQIINLLNEKA